MNPNSETADKQSVKQIIDEYFNCNLAPDGVLLVKLNKVLNQHKLSWLNEILPEKKYPNRLNQFGTKADVMEARNAIIDQVRANAKGASHGE